MKQIVLNIPENKFKLFVEFIKNVEFIKEYNELEMSIPKDEQNLILERIKKTKKKDLKQWEEVANSFNLE
jgi:hypothetical protein